MWHCPLTWAPPGAWYTPGRNFRGQCCSNDTEIMTFTAVKLDLSPVWKGVGGQISCSITEIVSHDFSLFCSYEQTLLRDPSLSKGSHGFWIVLDSAGQWGLRILRLQQVCWRRDESKDTACWIAAFLWYQITNTHRSNLCFGVSIHMPSDADRRAVAGAYHVWFYRVSFMSSLCFSFLDLLKHFIRQLILYREAKAIH